MPNEFATMREIGRLFGVTNHTIGRKLKELGLRTPDGKPSSEAFSRGLVEQKWTDDHKHYCWVWHIAKTVPLLEKAGLVRQQPEVP
ncbi:MAG: hypothetical protein K2R98_05255 [Gemmataceae bacterium]|nr:hypothetical protein [Gemmataceae bacterium]